MRNRDNLDRQGNLSLCDSMWSELDSYHESAASVSATNATSKLPCWNYVCSHQALVTEENSCPDQMLGNVRRI